MPTEYRNVFEQFTLGFGISAAIMDRFVSNQERYSIETHSEGAYFDPAGAA